MTLRKGFFEHFQGLAVEGARFRFATAGADDVGEIAGRQTRANVEGAETLLHRRQGLALERFGLDLAVGGVK